MQSLWIIVIISLCAASAKGEGKCPQGWPAFGDYCYFFSTTNYNYDVARSVCQDREGDLVSITSQEESEFIKFFLGPLSNNYWLGLRRDDSESDITNGWEWLDGSTQEFSDWREDYPMAGQGDCVQNREGTDLSWMNNACTNSKPFVCKRRNDILDVCDLDNDWHPYAGRCYKYFTDDATWSDASTVCQNNKGSLAVLDTNEKLDVFREIVSCKDFDSGVWIGLSDTESAAKDLHWVTGERIGGAHDWDDDQQPVYLEDNNNCVEAMAIKDYKWRVELCNVANKFVCEKDRGTCADGWQDQGTNFCYQVVSDPAQMLTWSDAMDRCNNIGAQLMRIIIPAEQAALVAMIQPLKDEIDEVKIGISDMQQDGVFRWDDGTTASSFSNWADNQPQDTEERWDCGKVNTASAEGKWQTTYCFLRGAYICQIPMFRSPIEIEDPPVPICFDGWVGNPVTGDCYYFDDVMMKYQEGRAYCKDLNQRANIVVVRDGSEQSFLNVHIRGSTWIALQYENSEWIWIDRGEKTTFVNWDPESRGDPNSKPIVRMRTGNGNGQNWEQRGTWLQENGNSDRYTACYMASAGTYVPTSPAPTYPGSPYCGVGWYYDPTSYNCFKLGYNGGWTFTEAHTACLEEGDGSDLASILSIAEQTYINSLIHSTVGGAIGYWIGLNDRDLDQGWQWTDGSPVAFFFWNTGEPNGAGSEFCVELAPEWNDRWNDKECEYQLGYVCKKKSTRYTTDLPPNPTDAPEPCEGDGEPLISGKHFIEDDHIRPYYYSPSGYGSWEVKRGPHNSRIDNEGEGQKEATCPNRMTDGVDVNGKYNYQVMNIEGWQENYILFTLKACSQGHIALANQQDLDNAELYEIVFGGWENSRVAIRRCLHHQECGDLDASVNYAPLKCDEDRRFWVTWTNGQIQFGRDYFPNENIIIRHTYTENLVDVKWFGITTAQDIPGEWCIPQEFPAGRGGSWTAFPSDKPQELEIFLHEKFYIHAVEMRGAADRQEWVTVYQILYRLQSIDAWSIYADATGNTNFNGSTDSDTKVYFQLHAPILANYVKIKVIEWHSKISMRLELYGCRVYFDPCEREYALSGAIYAPTSRLTASSFQEDSEPWRARLNGAQNGWMPQEPFTKDEDWYQVRFDSKAGVHSVSTQGGNERQMWVTSYKVTYSHACWVWRMYQEPYGTDRIFNGNTDSNTVVRNALHTYVHAQCMRIYPQEWSDGLAMRLDFEISICPGCQPTALITGENHYILDMALSVSSYWNDALHGAPASRLDKPMEGGVSAGAWCAGSGDGIGTAWIQADLGYRVRLLAIATQGRNGHHEQWVTKYSLEYSREQDGAVWHDYQEDGKLRTFEGNFNKNFARKHYFVTPFTARLVKLWPLEHEGHIAVRWELYGCPGSSSREELGCWTDYPDNRDLPYEQLVQPPGGLTHEICAAHCASKGYSFAGAQYGSECYCGNSYGKYGLSTSCTMLCGGDYNDPRSTCGGHWSNDVFSTGLSPSMTRCAEGYREYNDKCWKAFTDKEVTWQEARFACQAENGELATINSISEQNFVNAYYPNAMWIGLHCQQENYIFEWASQEPVLFTNWARREPNDYGDGEDCVISSAGGKWNDFDCPRTMRYLCQKGKEVLPSPEPTVPDESCPSGWTGFRWKCFTLRTDLQSWTDHKSFCESTGGTLARVVDNFDQSFLQSYIADKGEDFWTDLNDRDDPGSFKWTNNEYPSFAHWTRGQPDITNEPSCAAIKSMYGFWFDYDCDEKYGAICERLREDQTWPPSVPTNPGGACSSGWDDFGNHCYQFFSMTDNLKRNWEDALKFCQDQGADLVSIQSDEENLFIFEKVSVRSGNAFTGLSRRGSEGFKWSDGTSANFFRWDDEEPDEDISKECVELNKDKGKWAMIQCGATRNWVCKIDKGQTPQTTPVVPRPSADPPGSCSPDDDNWKRYNDVCYYFSGIELSPVASTWHTAQTWCNENGGHLTSIHDSQTQAFIEGQVTSIESSYMWIGLHELNGQGYEWIDGSVGDFTNWDDGGPDDKSQLCVAMSIQYNNLGKWRNRNCGLSSHFICAKKQGTDPIATPRPPPIHGGCPDGYIPFESKCFKFVDEQINWGTAQQRCLDENRPYSLASINDVYDQSFITSMMQNKDRNYWVGLHQVDGKFVWVDNSNMEYTNWAQHEPNGGQDEQCVHVYSEEARAGQWNDEDCETTHGYICMTYKDTSTEDPGLPDNGRCKELAGDEWFLWNDDCYKIFHDQSRNWEQAEARCAQDGAHLASVLDPYENGFLHASMGWYSDQVQRWFNLWIGFTDKDSPGSYKWSDGWMVTYTTWANNQPDRTDPSCVILNYGQGKWMDVDCNDEYWAICKHSLKDPVTRPPPSGQCPIASPGTEWYEYGDSCYTFSADKVNLAEARHQCFLQYADLVSIQNEEENEWIKSQLPLPNENKFFWIGLAKTQEGGFIWTDNRPYAYNNWEDGEPSDEDGSQGENCVEMYSSNGKWNDIGCANENAYVCKYYKEDATPPNTPGPSVGSTIVGMTTTFPAGSSGLPPSNGPSTSGPDGLPPPNGGGSGMSAGGVVGLVFFLLFVLLAAVLIALFVMRRRGQPIPGITDAAPAINGDGFENPGYGSSPGSMTVAQESGVSQA